MLTSHHEAHAIAKIEKQDIAASLVGAGKLVKFSLAWLAEQFKGAPAYLVGLRIHGTVNLTADVALNTMSHHGFIAQRAIANMRFVVEGNEHLANCDGEDIAIDEALRGYNRVGSLTFAPLATGTGNTAPVDICIRLDEPMSATERRHDAAIPCALFENDQKSFLEFTVGQGLDTGGQLSVGAAGFASGLSVTAYVVMRDDVSVYAPWRLRVIHENQLEHRIQPLGSIVYLINANRAVNLAARVDHSAAVFQHLKVGGEILHTQLSVSDYLGRVAFDRPTAVESLSAAGHKTDQSTATHGWCGTPLILPPHDTRKTKLTRGEIGIKLASMPAAFTDGRIRYLMRETGATSNDHANRVAIAMGVDPAMLQGQHDIFEVKAVMGGGEPAASVLPLRIKDGLGGRFSRIASRFRASPGGRRKKRR